MLKTVYSGLAGMLSLSKGLQGISSNVANINSTGYKKNDYSFSSLVSQDGLDVTGVKENRPSILLTEGDSSTTGNDLDLFIKGNGFFILESNSGEQVVTREGRFEFTESGNVIHKSSGFNLQALNNGKVEDINIDAFRSFPFAATSKVELSGNLSLSAESHEITDVRVVDGSGAVKLLTLKVNNISSIETGAWSVEVFDGEDKLGDTQTIRFRSDGTPRADSNSVSATLVSDEGVESSISFNFGEPQSYSGVTSFSSAAESSAKFASHNGTEVGIVSKVLVNKTGQLVLEYSNGESKEIASLAVANINHSKDLIRSQNNVFRLSDTHKYSFGSISDVGSEIESGKLELSNVELSEEFSNMIVLQRGYQASSQVMTTANEMLQQLLDASKGR